MKEIEQYLKQNGWVVVLTDQGGVGLKQKRTGVIKTPMKSVGMLHNAFPQYIKSAIEDFLADRVADLPKPLTPEESFIKLNANIYYFSDRFWHKATMTNGDPLWRGYSERSLKRYLADRLDVDDSNVFDQIITKIENEQNIMDVCTLAGYEEGVYSFQHGPTLIMQSPTFIEPEQGEFPMLDRLLTEMLGEKQKEYFLGWLKVAVENLRNGPEYSVRGQALFLVGEIGTCKTLLQDIITYALGGRQADPHSYLIRDTTFNADLFGAEHLLLGDKRGQSWEERGDYSMGLKELIANNQHHRHEKGRTPQIYEPKWRITVSLNTDDDSLKVIPIITAGLEDKISILTVNKPHMEDVIPTDILRNDKTLLKVFCDELPQFIHHLLNVHKIKPELQANRFGVVAYRDTEIENKLKENINYEALEEVLRYVIDNTVFQGSCTTLLKLMREAEVPLDKSFNSIVNLGRQLAAMADIPKYSQYIQNRRTATARKWIISFDSNSTAETPIAEDPDWWKNVKL